MVGIDNDTMFLHATNTYGIDGINVEQMVDKLGAKKFNKIYERACKIAVKNNMTERREHDRVDVALRLRKKLEERRAAKNNNQFKTLSQFHTVTKVLKNNVTVL